MSATSARFSNYNADHFKTSEIWASFMHFFCFVSNNSQGTNHYINKTSYFQIGEAIGIQKEPIASPFTKLAHKQITKNPK